MPTDEHDPTLDRFVDRDGRRFDVGAQVDIFLAPDHNFSGRGTVVGVDHDNLLVGSPGGTNPRVVRASELKVVEATTTLTLTEMQAIDYLRSWGEQGFEDVYKFTRKLRALLSIRTTVPVSDRDQLYDYVQKYPGAICGDSKERVSYHLGTESLTDVYAHDKVTSKTWLVCSTNVEADRPYYERVHDAMLIRELLEKQSSVWRRP